MKPMLGWRKRIAVLITVEECVVDFLAMEQRAQHTQILAERLGLDRVLAHDPHGGVARADAEKNPAGRELVDRGDGMRRHRREPNASHRDTRSQPNARGIGSRQRKRRVGVGIEHLGVGRPGTVVAHRLQIDEQRPVADARRDRDTEFHGRGLRA
jgi:hypothetical protein